MNENYLNKSLVEWQAEELPRLRTLTFKKSSVEEVTVLAYYFRKAEDYDKCFWRTEFAFLKTFELEGKLPSVLVVNQYDNRIAQFCDNLDIKLVIEPSLIVGDINTLSVDCIANLHRRFETKYVLTIQDDGFPLRSGLAEFVGKYDYIGAPWVHHNTYYDLYPYKYCVGNGGFSLRSKRICEAASQYYRKYFKRMPYWWYVLGDDTFYCKTLRFWFPAFRKQFVWAPKEVASAFSIEHNTEFLPPGVKPFGFHGNAGWQKVNELGLVT